MSDLMHETLSRVAAWWRENTATPNADALDVAVSHDAEMMRLRVDILRIARGADPEMFAAAVFDVLLGMPELRAVAKEAMHARIARAVEGTN